MVDVPVKVIIGAENKADGVLNTFAGTLGAITVAAAGFVVFNKVNQLINSFTGYLGDSLDAATNFQTTMSNISTIISGDSASAIDDLSNRILNLSEIMPKTADDLGAGAYDIMSAGITEASQTMSVLEASTKLSTAGLGELSGATDLMTSSINAFGLDASDSNKIADILFKTVNFGKTTVDQLRTGFGALAPTAASAGASLEEVMGAVSAMTTTGLPANEAYTQLRATFKELLKPGDDLSKALKKAGISNVKAAIESKGFGYVLETLKKSVGGNEIALQNLFGSMEAGSAAVSLTTTVSKQFRDITKEMTGGADALSEAYDKQAGSAANLSLVLDNRVKASMIKLGDQFLPISVQFKELKTQMLEGFTDLATKAAPYVSSFFEGFFEGFSERTPEMKEQVEELKTAVVEMLKAFGVEFGTAQEAQSGFFGAGQSAGMSFADLITKIIGKVTDLVVWTTNHKEDIKEFFSDGKQAAKDIYNVGKDIHSIMKAIYNAVNDVADAYTSANNKAKSFRETVAGIAFGKTGKEKVDSGIKGFLLGKYVGGGQNGGYIRGYNTGGFVSGPKMGNGRDNILVRAEEDEVILNGRQQNNIMTKLDNAKSAIPVINVTINGDTYGIDNLVEKIVAGIKNKAKSKAMSSSEFLDLNY